MKKKKKTSYCRHVPQEGVHPPPSFVTPLGSSSKALWRMWGRRQKQKWEGKNIYFVYTSKYVHIASGGSTPRRLGRHRRPQTVANSYAPLQHSSFCVHLRLGWRNLSNLHQSRLFPLPLPLPCLLSSQAPIAQSHSHSILDKTAGGAASARDGGSSVGSGRTSPLSTVTEQQQQRQMANGGAATAATSSSGDEAAKAAIGGAGNSNGGSAGGAALDSSMGAGRYGRGPGDGSLSNKQQGQGQQQQFNASQRDGGYGNSGGAAESDFGMGSLSLGPGGGGAGVGGSKALGYGGGAGSSSRLGDPYGGGGGNSNNSSHHLLDGSRGGTGGMGIGLHAGGMMPPSPYNGPQMSPYGGPQPGQAALMGGMPPLTPELHSANLMNYQLVRDRERQLAVL